MPCFGCNAVEKLKQISHEMLALEARWLKFGGSLTKTRVGSVLKKHGSEVVKRPVKLCQHRPQIEYVHPKDMCCI